METQTRLSRHNKFISAENIVGIFSVSKIIYIYIYNLGHNYGAPKKYQNYDSNLYI